LDLVGAVGVVAWLWIPPVGLGAASGIVVYFMLAIADYRLMGRSGGDQNWPSPFSWASPSSFSASAWRDPARLRL
jgi:hypothetical protein